MLCLILILFCVINISIGSSVNVGTAVFHDKHPRECWSEDQVAELQARKLFQNILPQPVSPDKINKKYIRDALRFYRKAMHVVQNGPDRHTSVILKQALADAIGGHLRSEMLPTVRFAYYAGHIPYKPVRDVHELYEDIKTSLNTKGVGWNEAVKVPQWSNLTVTKILIGSGKFFNPCSCLVTKRDSNQCIHLPPLKIDDYNEPTAIVLPFKTGGLVSLTSPDSENALLKYYTTASRCILKSSPKNCRHSDFVSFNNELWHWMKRDVAPHLTDEKLYVAYGGVLRIAAAVQNYGKGLARRNLFDHQDNCVKKWHPLQSLKETYLYINADWTPWMYVGVVLIIALSICMLQVCYNYMFGDAIIDCPCRKVMSDKNMNTNEIAYASVETSFPSLLPTYRSVAKLSRKSRSKHSGTKTSGSMKTQRVYDLNENAEKLIKVVMKGNEHEQSDSSLSGYQPEGSKETTDLISLNQARQSPPELETSISQLKVDNRTCVKRTPSYSTSTGTQSDVTYKQQASVWSATESDTSDRSSYSETSKTRSLKSRSSRDLAWARRVVSKHSLLSHSRSTTNTDFDHNSFTTPQSHR